MAEKNLFIDLRNDSLSTPTEEMQVAMRDSHVGDDVYGEDPTINNLQMRISEYFGKEAALFMPSRTMSNQISIQVNCKKGNEIIVGLESHIVAQESGAAGIISGVQTVCLPLENGRMNLESLEKLIRKDKFDWIPKTALICVENPSQGYVLDLEYLQNLKDIANKYSIPVHMDGSRIINAAFALNCSVKDIAQYSDTITFVLTQGLCCPIGAVLVGTKEIIGASRQARKVLGGGLRQIGILGGPALIALDSNINEIKQDNEMASLLFERLSKIEGLQVDSSRNKINIVYCRFKDSQVDLKQFQDFMLSKKIKISFESYEPYFRFFVYRNIREESINSVADAVTEFSQQALSK